MKVKDLIRTSKGYWDRASRMYPAFLPKGQTEITWEDYYKAKQEAEDFDNKDVVYTADDANVLSDASLGE